MSEPIRPHQDRHRRRRKDRPRPASAGPGEGPGLSPHRGRQPTRQGRRHPEFPDHRGDARRGAGTRCCLALHAAAIPLRCRADGARSEKARLPGKAAGRHGQRGRGPEGAGGGKRRLAVRQLAFALRAGGGGRARLPRSARITLGRDQLEGRRAPLAPEPGMDLGAGRLRCLRSRHQRAVDRDPHPAGDVHHLGRARFSGEPRMPRSRRKSPSAPRTDCR